MDLSDMIKAANQQITVSEGFKEKLREELIRLKVEEDRIENYLTRIIVYMIQTAFQCSPDTLRELLAHQFSILCPDDSPAFRSAKVDEVEAIVRRIVLMKEMR